jgi:hypothetical protein
MDERRIDFSPLDPGRDPERLERMVRAVLDRAGEPPEHLFASTIVDRGRLAVLAAAAVAALAWVPALVRGRPAAPAASDPLVTVVSWAEAGAIPEGADLYRVLGVNDER